MLPDISRDTRASSQSWHSRPGDAASLLSRLERSKLCLAKGPLRNTTGQLSALAKAGSQDWSYRFEMMPATMNSRDVGADSYLCLNEGAGEPRACWIKARRRYGIGMDCMLVAVEPPVIGQPYGLGNGDIYYLLLATMWQGPISQWPTMYTYCAF
jgi:hypothetical protein